MTDVFVYDDDFTDGWTTSEPVVLAHGFGRNGGLWRGWLPYLGRRHRVLRPELPGCGRSPDPGPGFVFTTEAIATLMLSVLDERGLGRVHWVGEGLGGVLGAAIAAEHPDRISTLTVLTTPTQVDSSLAASHGVGHDTWEGAIRTLGTREWWVQARTSANDLSGNAAFDTYLADEVGRTPTHIAAALSRWAQSWSYHDMLPNVQVPTLFSWAEGAKFMPKAARDEVVSMTRNGRQWLAPGVHSQMFHFMYPDLVAPEIARFIDGHSTAPVGRFELV